MTTILICSQRRFSPENVFRRVLSEPFAGAAGHAVPFGPGGGRGNGLEA